MDYLLKVYGFIFGCLIGSFLNVVILRIPHGKNIVSDRSECPKCKNKLTWYHNVPIISYALLRGKCGFCSEKISFRYPLVEILTGLLALHLFPAELNLLSLSYSLWFFAIGCLLICHFFIDLDHQLLLDKLNIYLLVLFLPYVLFHYSYWHWGLGAVFGFGITYLVTWIFYKVRGVVGLGGGDIKLYGVLGLYLGVQGIILNIFLSCFLGAIIGGSYILLSNSSKDRPIPFGPFIIIVACIQIFFPQMFEYVQNFLIR